MDARPRGSPSSACGAESSRFRGRSSTSPWRTQTPTSTGPSMRWKKPCARSREVTRWDDVASPAPTSRGAATDAAPRAMSAYSALARPRELGLGSVAVKQGGTAGRRRSLELGWSLPSRGPLARVDVPTRLARTADGLGYSVLTISDHVVLPSRSSAPYPYDNTGPSPVSSPHPHL